MIVGPDSDRSAPSSAWRPSASRVAGSGASRFLTRTTALSLPLVFSLSLSLSLSPPLVFSFALAPSRLPPRALPSRSLSLSLFKPGCGLTACSRGSRPTPHLCTPRATCQHSQLRPWRLRDDAALGLRRQSCRPCQGTGREVEALTSRSTSSGTSVGILLQLGVDPDDASATNTIANNRLHSRSGEISKERARRLSEKCALSRKRKIALRQTSDP